MGLEPFLDILKRLRNRHPEFSQRMKEADAVSRWEKTVGGPIARYAKAILVRDGVLWVQVSHPLWRSELHYRKAQILDRLNEGQKDRPIRDLFFMDPRKRKTSKEGSTPGFPKPK